MFDSFSFPCVCVFLSLAALVSLYASFLVIVDAGMMIETMITGPSSIHPGKTLCETMLSVPPLCSLLLMTDDVIIIVSRLQN